MIGMYYSLLFFFFFFFACITLSVLFKTVCLWDFELH